ncbi:hypothetical protein DSO57_1035919 [Entomophthora muscae]|uniref:Uncharacterized protein n=1 Tax=Entomophthora muscae TaxID=34485 RepID=A0ACC2SZF7_9FUNG|nr:hypothetical protein DSO57_1035919 [Entomophthora muscae]
MTSLPSVVQSHPMPLGSSKVFSLTPSCTPWLLTGLLLMGLSAYFPQLSPVSSLWSPLQAVVPVLHWMASWWFVSPGWEPNLVSLAPLSHNTLVGKRKDVSGRLPKEQCYTQLHSFTAASWYVFPVIAGKKRLMMIAGKMCQAGCCKRVKLSIAQLCSFKAACWHVFPAIADKKRLMMVAAEKRKDIQAGCQKSNAVLPQLHSFMAACWYVSLVYI